MKATDDFEISRYRLPDFARCWAEILFLRLQIQYPQKFSTENVTQILRRLRHDQQRGTPITQTIIIQII